MSAMSSGFRSATRLTCWSWLDVMPPPAPVIEFKPIENASLLMTTPSTTYRGKNAPFTVLAPRIVTCMPPPGAPLFCVMTAPGWTKS